MKTERDVMCIVLFIMVASNQLLPEVTKKEILLTILIVELAEHSPIIIQNSSIPSSQKNLDVRLVLLRHVGKIKCKLCFQAWLNLYIIFSSNQVMGGRKIPTKGIPFNLTDSLILTTKNIRKVQQAVMRSDMQFIGLKGLKT